MTFNDGEQAIIEMELRPKDDFKKRSQFLLAKAYSSQNIGGFKYKDLKKCYIICITTFTLLADRDNFYNHFQYRDEDGKNLTDDSNIIFVELSKLEKLLNKPVESLTFIEMWVIFLRYAADKSKRELIMQILSQEEGIKMATQILEGISKSERERIIYEGQLLFEADSEAELSYAKRTAREEGM